jgi:hypothetical protein
MTAFRVHPNFIPEVQSQINKYENNALTIVKMFSLNHITQFSEHKGYFYAFKWFSSSYELNTRRRMIKCAGLYSKCGWTFIFNMPFHGLIVDQK